MGAWLGGIVGLTVCCLGFAVMRDPMRLLWLAPGSEGYYQRLVLDRSKRVSLRLIGALGSLLGLVILTACLGSLSRLRSLQAASDALLSLLWILFLSGWCAGVIVGVIQLLRGKTDDWFQFWKRSVLLGPITVYPDPTPAMGKEARRFTVAFVVLVVMAVAMGFLRR